VLIGLVMQVKIIKHFCHNVEIWKEHNRQKLNTFFLGIKFKVRMYRRHCKKFGWDYEHRIVNYTRRHLTLLAPAFHENKAVKARACLNQILSKHALIKVATSKVRKFVKTIFKLQELWRNALENTGFRKNYIEGSFNKEADYLIWHYTRKLKVIKGGKAGKASINGTLDKLHLIRGDMSDAKVDLLESCLQRLRADYLLDYTVWKLL